MKNSVGLWVLIVGLWDRSAVVDAGYYYRPNEDHSGRNREAHYTVTISLLIRAHFMALYF